MKNLFTYLIFCIVIISQVGCNNDDNDTSYPYYEFNQADEVLLIKYNYVPNQIITYENQFDEQIHLKVILNERKKCSFNSRGTLSGGGGILQNYYDSKIIRFELLENPSNEDYSKINYIFSKNNDEFNNGINFPMWNITNFAFINELQDKVNISMLDYNNLEKTQMNINEHKWTSISEYCNY